MATRPEIESLVRKVGQRHAWLSARRMFFTGLLIAGGLCIAVALPWVLRGYAVPGWVAVSSVAAVSLGVVSWWRWQRMNASQAASEADRFFELKDAITSARHLAAAHPDDPMTGLQWQWLKPRLSTCDPATIHQPFPTRRAMASLLLVAIAVWLLLLPASPRVLEAERSARETKERVVESKEQLEKLIEELEKETTAAEEKEALKLDEFRQLVKDIEETGDRTEAARQFARIEQKLRDVTRSLEQRRDEETLQLAAEELAKAEQTEPRQLAKKLSAKDFKAAAEMLDQLAAKKADPKQIRDAKTPEQKKKIEEAKQEIARMRAISKRLATAGKQRQGARQANASQGANGASGSVGEGLEDMMAELDQAAAQMESELQEIEIDPNAKPGKGNGMGRANGLLGKLNRKMRAMHGRRMAMSKLDQLRLGLASAQGFTQGSSQSLSFAANSPGQGIGTGSSMSDRKEKDDSQKNGQLAELKGTHGSGPSLSSVEAADSGTGVSGRRGEARQRDFARQTESFVQRDDVPEALKLGVRNYFENLQSTENANPPPSE